MAEPNDHSGEGDRSASAWDQLADLPSMEEAPLDASWLRGDPPANGPNRLGPPAHENAEPPRDQRRFHVAAAPPAPVSRPPLSPAEQARHVGPMGDEPLPPEWGAPDQPAPTRRRRRASRRWLAALVALPLLALAAFGLISWYLWAQVDKVDTENTLASSSGEFTNYLIVGVDSRDGIDPNLETAPQIGLGFEGSRSDTMIVLHIGSDGNRMMSLHRDLWVSVDGSRPAKLNAATVIGGPPSLVRTVQDELGIPLHRYLEVDLAGFLSVIDAVGSITIEFESAACDPKSGLDVRTTGPVALGSEQALAYVRSRTYTEFDPIAAQGLDCAQINSAGLGTAAGVADFGRTERQREFLFAVFDKVSSTRNPFTVLRVLSGLTNGLRVDDGMGIIHAVRLLRDLRGLDAQTLTLPVSDFAAPDGSSALSLNAESDAILDLFRG